MALSLIEGPYFKIPFSANEGMFTHIAQEMRLGSKLYQDVWDHKPPLLFLHFVFLQDLFGNGEFAVRAYAVFFHFLGAILLFLLVQKLTFGKRTAYFTVWTYVILLLPPYFQAWTPQAELLLQPFLIASFLFAVSENVYSWGVGGAAWAISFLPNRLLWFFFRYFFLKKRRQIKSLWVFFLGADILAVGVILPFLMSGCFPLLSNAIWGANKAYVFQGWEYFFNNATYRQHVLWWHGIILLAYGLPLAAFVNICSGRLLAEKSGYRNTCIFLILWTFISFFSCFISGYFHPYYYFMFLPPLSIGVGVFLESMLAKKKPWFLVFMAVMLFGLWVPWFKVLNSGIEGIKNSEYIVARSTGSKEVGLYLKEIAWPGQHLMVWASEAQIYTYSGLKMAVLKSPLGSSTSNTAFEWMGLKNAFTDNYPDYVVLSHFDQLPVPPNWLQEELESHYLKVKSWGNYDLFSLKK